MARKLENPLENPHPTTGPSALRILDWDEGGPYPHGWFGVEISYRRARPDSLPDRPPLRAVIDQGDTPSKY